MGVRWRLIAVAAACLLLPAAAAPVAAQDLLKLAVGQRGFWDTSMPAYGERQGFFKEEGIDLDLLYTDGGAETQQAVISGSVDLGIGNGLLGVIGAYVKGAPVRVVGAGFTGASDLYWYARTDSGIDGLKDAAGKTIGFSSVGSSTNLVVLDLIKQAGVKAKPTPTGGAPATLTQVMSGQIDIGWSVPPFGLNEIESGKIRIVARGSDLPEVRNQTIRVTIANADMLAKRRDAVTRFMRAYARTLDWAYHDPKAIDYFAEMTKVPRAQAQKARDEFYPKEAMQIAEVKGLDLTLKQAYDYKRIPSPMTPSQVEGLIDIVYKPDS
jgi:NitT/TauT family transport system substrate-binding protein